MCVAGKNMLEPEKYDGSIGRLIKEDQLVFKPEARDILTLDEWDNLQQLHDCIARNACTDRVIEACDSLNLFSYEELVEASKEKIEIFLQNQTSKKILTENQSVIVKTPLNGIFDLKGKIVGVLNQTQGKLNYIVSVEEIISSLYPYKTFVCSEEYLIEE